MRLKLPCVDLGILNHTPGRKTADYFYQDEYSILNSKHFIGIHGYMLVYSVASRQSFEMVRIIRDKILNHLVCFPRGILCLALR